MSKPAYGTPLNTSHALANGLIGCWILNENTGTTINNLIGPAATSMTGSVWATGANSVPVLRHDTTTDRTALFASSASLPTQTVSIVLVKYRKTDGTNRASAAFGTVSAAENSTDSVRFYCPYTNGNSYFDWGGSGSTNRCQANGLTHGDDTWVLTAGSRGLQIWQNGNLRQTNATYVPATHARVAGSVAFNLGGSHTGISSDLADYEAVLIYNRQLTTDEIASITSNPYQMIRLLAPTELAEVGYGGGLLTVGWVDNNDDPNEASFTVEWDTVSNFATAQSDSVSADNTDYQFLATPGTWYVRVKAVGGDDASESDWSDTLTVVIPGPGVTNNALKTSIGIGI